jgi:type II secretory pathway component PulF
VGEELLAFLVRVGQSWWWRIPWPPIVLLLFLFIAWRRTNRAGQLDSGFLRRVPSYQSLLRCGRSATFAELLALLLEHQVPLGEALRLAGDASGDKAMRQGAAELADRLERGEAPEGDANRGQRRRGLPPYLSWLLIGPASHGRLPAYLRQAAEAERAKALRTSEWLSVSLPILLTTVIGGGTALVLALVVLGPWFGMLYQLGQP